MTKNNKPVGWFWIPTDPNLLVMHSTYVGGAGIPLTAGRTKNTRVDPNIVRASLLLLHKY